MCSGNFGYYEKNGERKFKRAISFVYHYKKGI